MNRVNAYINWINCRPAGHGERGLRWRFDALWGWKLSEISLSSPVLMG
jgi:hypothetical protein